MILEPFPVLQWPDPRLHGVCQDITPEEVSTEDFKISMQRLATTLIKRGGWGLAAPQVGWMKRVVVIVHPQQLAEIGAREDGAPGDWRLDIVGLVNPVVVERRFGQGRRPEGCLSFQGGGTEVLVAYEDIDVECPDTGRIDIMPLHTGKLRYIGLAARCAQHEIDHLDGKVFTSRMGPMQRRLFLKRLEKARRHERSRSS